MKTQARILVELAALAALAAGSIANAAEPLQVTDMQTITSTVTSIDVAKRMVTLKGADGREETLELGPGVRNLDQVRVGDKVVVRSHRSMLAAIRAKGTSKTLKSPNNAEAEKRAALGAKPGGMVGSTVTTTVIVQSVDMKNNTVSFTATDGHLRTVPLQRPEAKKFAATLKKGDEVEVTYTEALAVSVEPAK